MQLEVAVRSLDERNEMRRARRQVGLFAAAQPTAQPGALLALEAIAHGTSAHLNEPAIILYHIRIALTCHAYQAQALAQDPAGGHVLLRLQLGQVDRRGENEEIRHGGQALQEAHGHFDGQSLGGLDDIEFALRSITKMRPSVMHGAFNCQTRLREETWRKRGAARDLRRR